MRILIILTCIVLVGCSEHKKEESLSHEKLTSKSFNQFFKKFSTDSVFQKSRIEFPLYYSFTELEDDVIHKVKMEKGNWDYTNFLLDSLAKNKETDKFEVSFTAEKDKVLYLRKGIDNGIYIEYVFSSKEGQWYLTEIIDSST